LFPSNNYFDVQVIVIMILQQMSKLTTIVWMLCLVVRKVFKTKGSLIISHPRYWYWKLFHVKVFN